MKCTHFLIGALALTGVFLGVYSCMDDYILGGYSTNGQGVREVKIRSIQAGLMQEPEKHSLFDELKDRDKEFVAFKTVSEFDMMYEGEAAGSVALPGDFFPRNRVEYQSEVRFAIAVRTVPEDAAIKDVIAVSSNDTVLHVVGYNPFQGIICETGTLGDADLTVTVKGAKNEMTDVFPIRVVSTIEAQFRITPFWLGNLASKLRVKYKHFPDDKRSLVLFTADSIEVCGLCEYYTPWEDGYLMKMHQKRDTIRLPLYNRLEEYKKGSVYKLREISGALQEVRSWSVPGQRLNDTGMNMDQTYIPYDYPFKVEQVILYYDVLLDNPFVVYDVAIKCKHTVTTHEAADGGKDGKDKDDDDDGPEMEDGDNDDPDFVELEEKEKNYFIVRFNDRLTPAQRDSINNWVQQEKDRVGFDEELPDSTKQKQLDEINEKLK